jgi:hypothetical protein
MPNLRTKFLTVPPVVQQLGGGDRGLAVVELGERHLGVSVDEGLLVNPPNPLQRADIEGVLGTAIAGAFAVEFAVGFLLGLGLLQAVTWASVSTSPSCAILASSAFSRFLMFSRS